MKIIKYFFLFLTVLVLKLQAQNPLCYKNISSAQSFTVQGYYGKTFSDLNNDNFLDLIVIEGSSNVIAVYYGNSSGNYAVSTQYAVTGTVSSVFVKDVNGDSIKDILFGGSSGGIMKGNASNGFDPISYFTISGYIYDVRDFTGDNYPDLLMNTNASCSIVPGNGLGNFTGSLPVISSMNLTNLTIKDFNNDNKPDIVATDPTSSTGKFVICLASSTSTNYFLPPANYFVGALIPNPVLGPPYNEISFTTDDLNNDGYLDVAATSSLGISVFLNNGNGTLAPDIKQFTSYTNATYIKAADFNNDGSMDLAVSYKTKGSGSDDNFGSSLKILTGNGTGNFTLLSENKMGISPGNMLATDLNNDGNKDLLGSNGLGTIYVAMGNGTGQFSTKFYDFNNAYHLQQAIDINNDGNKEIIIAKSNYMDLVIVKGSSNLEYDGSLLIPTFGENLYPGVDVNDYNQDGNKDIAISSTDTLDRVSIYYSDAAGQLNSPVIFSKPPLASNQQKKPISGDFNQDGFLDIIYSGTILFGSASGITSQSLTTLGMVLGAADFNNDGKTDLLSYTVFNTIFISFGNGDGTFVNGIPYGTGPGPSHACMVDINNDNNLDVITANSNGLGISVFKGSATGTLSAVTNYTTGSQPFSVRTADFNHDGYLDIASANYGASSRNISILLGSATGAFSTYTTIPLDAQPYTMALGDLDADGNSDIIVNAVNSENYYMFYKGMGTGSFTLINKINVTRDIYDMEAADLNHDNLPDIISASTGYLSVIQSGAPNVAISTPNSMLCLGSSTILNTSGVNSYTWSTNQNSPSIVVNPTVTTTYSVVGKDALGCTNSATILVTVNSNTAPAISITGNTVVCAGSSLTFSATGANTYTWSNGTLGSSASYTPSANAIISVVGEDINGCQNTGTLSITVQPLPNIIIIGTNTICSGNTVTLTATGTGTNNLAWNTGAITPTLNVSPSNTTTYSVVATGTNGCSNSISKTITVQQTPTVTILGPNNMCSGTTSTLVAGGALTYTWSAGPISPTRTVSPTTSTSATVNYYVNGTSVNGCTTTAVFTATVFHAPSVLILHNTLCVGTLATFTVGAVSTATWSTGETTAVINVTPTANGSYTATGLDMNGCYYTAIKNYTVYPTPTLSIVAPASICQGSNANLSVSGASTYLWSNGAVGPSIIVTPSSTVTYTSTGRSVDGCYGTSTVQVNVNPKPIINLPNGSVCQGQTYTLAPTGANTYTYSGGSDVVTPLVTTSYTVTGADLNGCVGSITTQLNVNSNPTITVTGSGSVCEGSSVILGVNGTNTYLWSNGASTNSIAITPTITETYSVTGTDLNNCSTTQIVSVIVDNTCQDVWPGDVNSDGTADNLDVLELGLHYTQTGPTRATISNNWQSYFSNNWSGTITNGKNLNHSDCNGDGTINDNDTLAIFNNYGLTHAFKGSQQTVTNLQLTIVPDQQAVVNGAWGTASVYLGDTGTSISNVNGIAFTVNFDNTLIETNNIWIEYPNSFINASNQNLHFRKLDFSNSNLYTATTHTVSNNVNGNGLIAVLHYQIKSSLTTDQILNLDILQANQSDASGTITPLTTGTGTLMAIGASVGLNESIIGNLICISPNPASSSVLINSTTDLEKVEIINLTGQVLISETVNTNGHRLNIESLANGVYFVKAYNSSKQVVLKKLVIQK